MSPLDALSALNLGAVQMPVTQLTPPVQAAPIGEGFQQMLGTSPLTVTQPTTSGIAASSGDAPSTWGHMVQQMVMDVNNQQQSAAAKVSDVLRGGPTPVHEAMVATEEASLSFTFLSEVRNKVVDAYQQVMQMQV
jgi:flagellar hook-basal body complex protein FliE